MEFYLDSVNYKEIEEASNLGFLTGVTTTPTFMHRDGITNIDDIRALCEVADEGITGAITGRAIYEGTLDFVEGQKLADELAGRAE